jgi:CRP-like cAMP-binding protein
MRRDEKISHLASVRLFEGCSTKELIAIAKVADEETIPEGMEIVTEDTVGHEMFVVLEGGVSVRRRGRRVALLGPGQYFGELSVLRRGPRTATVVADMPTTLLVISRNGLASVLESAPGLTYKMLTTMAGRLQDLDARLM